MPTNLIVQSVLEYTNAVLLAVLPHVNDFCGKLELPLRTPVTIQDVTRFTPRSGDPAGGWLVLKNGFEFWCDRGVIDGFRSAHSYFGLEDPGRIPDFYGPVNLDQKQAIELARETIKKLGYTLESVFADLDPRVDKLEKVGKNIIPHYSIDWVDPRDDTTSITIEVDANAKRVQRLTLITSNPFLRGAEWARKRISPPKDTGHGTVLTGASADQALARFLPQIESWGEKLGLEFPRPLPTNAIASAQFRIRHGFYFGIVSLRNGYTFQVEFGSLDGFQAPSAFYRFDRHIKMRDFVGKWKISKQRAATLAREAVRKLDPPYELPILKERPEIERPVVPGKTIIPRYRVGWQKILGGQLETGIAAEIDGESGALHSLFITDSRMPRIMPPEPSPKGSLKQGNKATNKELDVNSLPNLKTVEPQQRN